MCLTFIFLINDLRPPAFSITRGDHSTSIDEIDESWGEPGRHGKVKGIRRRSQPVGSRLWETLISHSWPRHHPIIDIISFESRTAAGVIACPSYSPPKITSNYDRHEFYVIVSEDLSQQRVPR
jgi:hypothetical protein